ncbi:MAG: isoprenylcysteine carboxylmethyltransferase family protein [Elusimicrobia bacterium]|nr:isoprenylcysteine carboxylmethyltransferase family protein [Elusimicrobiota bacterium]
MKKRILVSQIIALAAILIAKPDSWKLFAAGMCFMLPGAVIRALASSAIVKARTLTVTGPYAAVRNPLYLGTAFMVLGLLVSLSNPQAPLRTGVVWLITAVSFTLIYRVQIKAEEEFLFAAYGEEFVRYKSRVNAILPRPAAVPGFFDRSAYSWETFRRNKEWRGFLGMTAIAAIVAARIKYGL